MTGKRLISVAALLALVVPSICYAGTLVYVEKTARFRAGPGTNYQILWEAPKYTPLEYLARYGKWYAVRDRDGDVGWVHKTSLGKGRAAIITVKKANVRKEPNVESIVKFTVEERYLFKVLEDKNGWLKVVDIDGDQGWIPAKLLWVSR